MTMPKLAEKQQTKLPLSFQLRWILFDLKNGYLPYFPLHPRDNDILHIGYHWTEFPRWVRAITRR